MIAPPSPVSAPAPSVPPHGSGEPAPSTLPPLPPDPVGKPRFDRSDFRAEKAAREVAQAAPAPDKRQAALRELDVYAKMAVEHSERQYATHGTLHDVAKRAIDARDLWERPWVPWDFDLGRADLHPVWQRWTQRQRLAWNHLQWGLDYTIVGRGEQQIIVLNGHAVSSYESVLPAVVDLEKRESFEEIDHLDAFREGLEALRLRYLPHRRKVLWATSPSGFQSDTLNRLSRDVIGQVAKRLLGSNFPTLFFLTRGMKTHNFKPFENAIASYEEAPMGIRQISHLHRLDESRHMATSLYLAKLSNVVLETVPVESRALFAAAVHASWPVQRQVENRVGYWKAVLHEAPIYSDVSRAEKADLLQHIRSQTEANLHALHPRQAQLTRQANKRIVEACGLSPEYKAIFVDLLRKDPLHASLVDAVDLDASPET
jgi:hypothetical protein